MKNTDWAFGEEAFREERGQFLESEDKTVCSCDNQDLLYCYVHKIHYAIINGKKTAVESKMNIL